jgi:hypothetical protein
MTRNSLKRSFIALALAAGIPLAAGTAQAVHAGNPPSITASKDNCVDYIRGSGFTPGGTVVLGVSISGIYYDRTEYIKLTATPDIVWPFPPYHYIVGGTISQAVYIQLGTDEDVAATAYDTASQRYSNRAVTHVYCIN